MVGYSPPYMLMTGATEVTTSAFANELITKING